MITFVSNNTLCVLRCSNPRGYVKNSVLSNVRCKYIEAENCVLINVTAEKIIAKPNSIIYNVLDDASATLVMDGTLQLNEKEVVVGVFDNDGKQFAVRSTTDIDGGKTLIFNHLILYFIDLITSLH